MWMLWVLAVGSWEVNKANRDYFSRNGELFSTAPYICIYIYITTIETTTATATTIVM